MPSLALPPDLVPVAIMVLSWVITEATKIGLRRFQLEPPSEVKVGASALLGWLLSTFVPVLHLPTTGMAWVAGAAGTAMHQYAKRPATWKKP